MLPALTTGDVFGVVPSEVNAVFDYTEYTRFGLWTSETIASDGDPPDGDPDVSEEQADAAASDYRPWGGMPTAHWAIQAWGERICRV